MFSELSQEIAAVVEATAPLVVQVQGRRRPISGVVFGEDAVVTTTRALGRGDILRIRRPDGDLFEAELAGWDPATHLAVLRTQGLKLPPAQPGTAPPRVGHLAVAVARSWSNALTASAGLISVIGGPLRTGPGRGIEQIIRTTAPMHEGFAGGAFVDTRGALIGIGTAAAIRGLGVVIPAGIAWESARAILEHGRLRRGYLGLAGQSVHLASSQRADTDPEEALLVVGVTDGSPAATAGILVGDIVLEFDGRPLGSPEDLLGLLNADRIGRQVPLRIRRGTQPVTLQVTVGERPDAGRVS
jgi:serine protease Do